MLEDDTTLGRGIQLALQDPDVTIALTGTLSQARKMLAQKKFDLLILDVNLPDGSALDLLRARVNAQLRRRVKFSCVELDGFRFDFERMAFWKNGEPIELSKTEQKLLRLLVENRGQTVSRGVLVDRIWTDGADFVDENALSVTVKRLRVKLEDDPSSPQYLKTVYGLGYTWAVK